MESNSVARYGMLHKEPSQFSGIAQPAPKVRSENSLFIAEIAGTAYEVTRSYLLITKQRRKAAWPTVPTNTRNVYIQAVIIMSGNKHATPKALFECFQSAGFEPDFREFTGLTKIQLGKYKLLRATLNALLDISSKDF